MAKRPKQRAEKGTVFLVPLKDQSFGVGQVLDFSVMGVPTVAAFDYRMQSKCELLDIPSLERPNCLAVITVSGGALKRRIWPMLGVREVGISWFDRPNEQFRAKNWIGSVSYTDNIVDVLLQAYFGLEYWDDFYKPDLLDGLLLPPRKRPENVMWKGRHSV